MLTRFDFNKLLRLRGTLVIDGALATELESRGHDLNHPLWSGKVLVEDPDSIQKVHLDYYLSGADVAITASYQTTTQGLREHFGMSDDEAAELMKVSVRLAQRARCEAYGTAEVPRETRLLVAGSVGPYGAYLADGSEYRGGYSRTAKDYEDFHRLRIKALVDAGVDLLAIETMPNLEEIKAVLELLSSEFTDVVAWVSVTLKDAEHMSDGATLKRLLELVERFEQVVAVGVNCVPMVMVQQALENMQADTELPLLCYPNSGETYDATNNTWHGKDALDEGMAKLVHDWTASGARLIGGCCRTGPKDIAAVRQCWDSS